MMKMTKHTELARNYEIRWLSKITKKEGGGKTRFFQSKAADIVRQLNGEYPDLEHYMFVT